MNQHVGLVNPCEPPAGPTGRSRECVSDDAFDTEIVYTLRSSRLAPTVRGARYEGPVIDLARRHALFGREPLFWAIWSTTWQQIARNEAPSADAAKAANQQHDDAPRQ